MQDAPAGTIVFSGKRIPPHPALTRYLVGHEYGHQGERMINVARGGEQSARYAFMGAYAQVRGLDADSVHDGSGGRWHDSAIEVLACDFRILACDVETDFWPHPRVPRPEEVDGLAGWWKEAIADVVAATKSTEP